MVLQKEGGGGGGALLYGDRLSTTFKNVCNQGFNENVKRAGMYPVIRIL